MRSHRRKSFTLIELLTAIAIASTLAAFMLVALYGATQMAKMSRTRSQVGRLNEMIMAKWEHYRTRPLPIKFAANAAPKIAAVQKLSVLRELLRLELPDRKNDLFNPLDTNLDSSVSLRGKEPAVYFAYRSRVRDATRRPTDAAGYFDHTRWSRQYQGAECLYMIIAETRSGGVNGLDHFQESEIGDVDRDGMKEILDGWGKPIEFLRWAPGFSDPNPTFNQSEIQRRDPFDHYPGPDLVWNTPSTPSTDDIHQLTNYDQFDGLMVDVSDDGGLEPFRHFALFPLIFSAGEDQQYDIATDYVQVDNTWRLYSSDVPFPGDPLPNLGIFYHHVDAVPNSALNASGVQNLANDPYLWLPLPGNLYWQLGKYTSVDYVDGNNNPIPKGFYTDNIHNHLLEAN